MIRNDFALLIVLVAIIPIGSSVATATTIINIPVSCSQQHTCVSQMQSAIDQCKSSKPSQCFIKLEPGVYAMTVTRSPVLSFDGVDSIQLAGAGSNATMLVFGDLAQFFTISSSKNIRFANFSVDMVRVPFTLGHVVSVNTTSTVLSVLDQTLYPTNASTRATYTYLDRAQAVIGYVPATERFQLPDVYSLADPISVSYSGTDGEIMTLGRGKIGTVGESLVVRHQVYALNAFSFSLSQNIEISDVVLYAAGGMGVLAQSCTNIMIHGFQTRRRRFPATNSVRAMSITADGIHITNCLGGSVDVISSILEGQGDDGLNCNSPFGRVVSISPDRRTVNLVGYAEHSANENFFVGNRGEVFAGRTMGFRLFTSAVVSVSGSGVTFADPLPAVVQLYDLMVNNNGQADRVDIEGNFFLNNRARGLLLKNPNANVVNNVFRGQTSPSILTQIDGCYWMEGRPMYNATIADNQLDSPDGFGPATILSVRGVVPVFDAAGKPTTQCVPISEPGVFANYTITRNTIRARPDSVEKAISVYGTQGLLIAQNSIMSTGGARRGALPDIQTQHCSLVRGCHTNKCYNMSGEERQCVEDCQ